MTPPIFKLTKLCANDAGESFFQLAGHVDFTRHASLDGTPNGFLSPEFKTDITRIHHFIEGTFEDWHTATLGEVYIVYLQGIQQITASSGETYDFSCGDILWLQDTHGKGHQTRVLASGYSVILINPQGIKETIRD